MAGQGQGARGGAEKEGVRRRREEGGGTISRGRRREGPCKVCLCVFLRTGAARKSLTVRGQVARSTVGVSPACMRGPGRKHGTLVSGW